MKKIIFSFTCHESIECILDLFSNIDSFFGDFDTLILVSTNEKINEELQHVKNDKIVITSVRKNNLNIWGNIELFNQHIINAKYLMENNIEFNYFWFLSSNEMFIKKVTPKFLDKNMIKLQSAETENNGYDDYFNSFNFDIGWWWWNKFKNDEYAVNFFKNYNHY